MKKQILTFLCATSLMTATIAHIRPASAHASIVTAAPAVNAVVTESPKQIRATFKEQLQLGSSLSLIDANKQNVETGKAVIDPTDASGRTLVADVPVTLAAGKYTVSWKTLSVDGHTEKGTYAFTLDLPNVTGDVTLRFGLMAGKEPVACGKDIANLGAKRTKAQIMDARLYLTNIRLISADGKDVPLQLVPDGRWQSDKVALLDFEDGTGLCKEFGTKDLRDTVIGKVPAGKYNGIAFDMGVPFEVNHADVTTSKTPLNVKAMWWNWQNGYKFTRIDLKTNAPSPKDTFFIHLGSTGCGEAAMNHGAPKAGMEMTMTMKMTATMTMNAGNQPPKAVCKNPNMVGVRLNNFDPTKNRVVADLASLLTSVDISNPRPEPAGCMSGINDPDCTRLFPNFGLTLATGKVINGGRGQKFFRVGTLP